MEKTNVLSQRIANFESIVLYMMNYHSTVFDGLNKKKAISFRIFLDVFVKKSASFESLIVNKTTGIKMVCAWTDFFDFPIVTTEPCLCVSHDYQTSVTWRQSFWNSFMLHSTRIHSDSPWTWVATLLVAILTNLKTKRKQVKYRLQL